MSGLEIWLKRDDLTGFGLGGNKVRKLEFWASEGFNRPGLQQAHRLLNALDF